MKICGNFCWERWCVCYCLFMTFLYPDEGRDSHFGNSEALFVSLGSSCKPAITYGAAGYRKFAFPLDWAISVNEENLIQLLQDDFFYLFSEEYILTYDPIDELVSGHNGIKNTYYDITFPHEEDCFSAGSAQAIDEFKRKYKRRVNRFLSLNNFSGKVFFIRMAPIHYSFVPILLDDAVHLNESLKEKFPRLDFTLIIINFGGLVDRIYEENRFENVIMVKAYGYSKHSVLWDSSQSQYSDFFSRLLEDWRAVQNE
jgi:hypothetical protein